MFYVSILPKYYLQNLTKSILNIDGQKYIKYNERVVLNSDEVEVFIFDHDNKWEMMNQHVSLNLSRKKEIVFFKQLFFSDHEANEMLKNSRRRKKSKTLDED